MMKLKTGVVLLAVMFGLTPTLWDSWLAMNAGVPARLYLPVALLSPTILIYFSMIFAFTGLGYGFLVWVGGFRGNATKTFLLSPLVGLIVTGFLLAVASATGLFGFIVIGGIILAAIYPLYLWIRNLYGTTRKGSGLNWVIGLTAVLCCLFYIGPYASGNGKIDTVIIARNTDSKLQFLDVDPSYDVAVTSVLMRSSPPHMPGMASERLNYHYASHAIAAAFSLPVGRLFSAIYSEHDAQRLPDNTFTLSYSSTPYQGAWGLTALQAATLFSLALALAVLAGSLFPRRRWAGQALIFTVLFGGATLIYRYGIQAFGSDALTGLFNDFLEFKLNRLLVHYYQFHSLIWTAVGSTVVFTLLTTKGKEGTRIPSAAAIIAVMMIPFNFIAGAGLAGMAAVVTLYEKRKNWAASEALIIGMGIATVLLFGGLQILDRAPTGNHETLALAGQIGIPLAQRLMRPWPELLLLNIGYILFNFPFAILLITGVLPVPAKYRALRFASLVWIAGFLFAAIFLNADFNLALYSTINLQIMAMVLNTLAILLLWTKPSQLQSFSLKNKRVQWTLIFLGLSVLIILLSNIPFLSELPVLYMIPMLITLLVIYLLTKPMFGKPFLVVASIWTLLTFAWMLKVEPTMLASQTKLHPSLSVSAEMHLLSRLDDIIPGDPLIATNRNDLEGPHDPIDERDGAGAFQRKISYPNYAGTSYLYSAVSGRRFFLEGYRFGEQRVPGFKEIFRDNQTIFNSTDPDSVWEVLERRKIDYILCKPGTDLSAKEELTSKLDLVSDSYYQRLYRVVR